MSFRYPAASEVSLASLESIALPAPEKAGANHDALADVSFVVPAGKLTALVGPSGAGKTTLTHLVSRLYDPTEGTVRIGGTDIRDVTLSSLHDVVGNRDVFALEVRGDSMRDEHIINGDYVLVEQTRTARQGEIVVALVHGAETTLKRFYSEGHVVRLQPANIEMEPIYVPAAQVSIQGRVLGVLRRYR